MGGGADCWGWVFDWARMGWAGGSAQRDANAASPALMARRTRARGRDLLFFQAKASHALTIGVLLSPGAGVDDGEAHVRFDAVGVEGQDMIEHLCGLIFVSCFSQ